MVIQKNTLNINQIQNIVINFYNIIKNVCGFLTMQRQIFINSQSTANQPINNLHNLFNHKHIVNAYTQRINNHLIFGGPQRHNKHRINSNQVFIQHPQTDDYPKKHKNFAEDDFFGELHSANIVENFSMLDQKDEPYQQLENIYKGRGQKPVYLNQDMFASSSENNDVPSRNSSLSSLSQKNQIINTAGNRSFMLDDSMQKNIRKSHAKSSLLNILKNDENNYPRNSQNQMDIENSPFESDSHQNIPINTKNYIFNNKSKQKTQHSYLIPPINARLQFNRNNAFVPQQKSPSFSTFRRMDIDEQRQKKQRLQKIQKIQTIGCNCKKSKCLKMYCECFNLQIFCNQNCNCVGCSNQQSNEQHRKAVLDALTRNPKAFNETTQKLDATFQLGVQLTQVKKGCKCKKTKCQKKYCECYNSGQTCGKFCKCEGCQNC